MLVFYRLSVSWKKVLDCSCFWLINRMLTNSKTMQALETRISTLDPNSPEGIDTANAAAMALYRRKGQRPAKRGPSGAVVNGAVNALDAVSRRLGHHKR
jgi:hypothetical protein